MLRSPALAPTAQDEPTALDHVVARLQGAFPSTTPQRIREIVETVSDSYQDAKIRRYVAIFVERESRDRLRDEATRPRESLASPSAPPTAVPPTALASTAR